MKYDLSNVLEPISQGIGKNVYTFPSRDWRDKIERFSPIATQEGITIEFQKFYDDVVEAVCSIDYRKLWEISDKYLNETEFADMMKNTWDATLKMLILKDKKQRGMDIEFNFNWTQLPTRNVILGFNVSGYTLERLKDVKRVKTKMKLVKNEILFTYQNGKYVVISSFAPWEVVDIGEVRKEWSQYD